MVRVLSLCAQLHSEWLVIESRFNAERHVLSNSICNSHWSRDIITNIQNSTVPPKADSHLLWSKIATRKFIKLKYNQWHCKQKKKKIVALGLFLGYLNNERHTNPSVTKLFTSNVSTFLITAIHICRMRRFFIANCNGQCKHNVIHLSYERKICRWLVY